MGTKYSTVSISGYNAAPPADDGSQVSTNQINWSKHKLKIGDPLKTAIESINSSLVTALDNSVRAITSADVLTAADHLKTIQCTATSAGFAVSLGDAATMAAGYVVTVHNRASSTGDVTVNLASATDSINNTTNGTRLLAPGTALTFVTASPLSGYLVISSSGIFSSPLWANVSGALRRLTAPNASGTLSLTTETDGAPPFPEKHISGLVVSNNGSDANNDIDISTGSCRDGSNAKNMVLSVAITKRLDANWAVGTNQGGLDTSSEATSTWYYVWLILRSDTGVVDALFSTSSTAPTMPANYDYKRLIGAVFNDGSSNITAFKAYETAGGGLQVRWDSPTLDVDISNTLTTSARTDTMKCPTAFSTEVVLDVIVADAAAPNVYVSCPDNTDLAPSTSAAPLSTIRQAATGATFGAQIRVRTSATGTIRSRADVATVDAYRISTISWDWSRR